MMRMRRYSCLITVALLCYPYVALGDAHSHRKAAETLLITMEVEKSLPQMTAQVVEIQVQQNPQLASQREVLQPTFKGGWPRGVIFGRVTLQAMPSSGCPL